jgi:hypothetical protein
MSDLSPAAQQVLDAAMQYEINPECYSREIAAAALRAAADQLSYSNVPEEFADLRSSVIDTDDLLAIAAELEAQ